MILSKHICVFKLAEDKSSLMYMIIEIIYIYILLLLAVDYNIFPLLIAGRRRRICFSYKQNIKIFLKLLIPVINNHYKEINGHSHGEINGHSHGEINGHSHREINGHSHREINGHSHREIN